MPPSNCNSMSHQVREVLGQNNSGARGLAGQRSRVRFSVLNKDSPPMVRERGALKALYVVAEGSPKAI